jgi:hypothetical protein
MMAPPEQHLLTSSYHSSGLAHQKLDYACQLWLQPQWLMLLQHHQG